MVQESNTGGNGEILTKTTEKKPTDVNIDVKIGLLHTIAKAIYATPVGKIREAVANAQDNGATWIVILADRTTNTLCVYDNGHGIDRDRFDTIFTSIGYGLLTTDPKTKLSYFGLGLMSIFQLGNSVKLFTISQTTKEYLLLEVNTKAIFDSTNKGERISSLKSHISIKNATDDMRNTANAPQLDEFLKSTFGSVPNNYTEIIIQDLNSDDLETICRPEFVDDLRKLLPLKVEPNEPFLKRFTGTEAKSIKALLGDSNFCPTIDVYFGVRGESINDGTNNGLKEPEVRQLWKYFPKFRSDIEFPDANVKFRNDASDDFAYYIVHTVAQDLHRNPEDPRENGFWVRNQNYLVKAADFLEKPGPGRRIISPPLRNWIYGEIFHKNMNHFLQVSRSDFLFTDNAFLEFREKIIEIVAPLDKKMRKIWEEKNKIEKNIIEPFSKIADTGGTIDKVKQRLRQLSGYDEKQRPEDVFRNDIFDKLKGKRNLDIERDEARIDKLLESATDPILLGDDKNLLVTLDPKLKEIPQEYQVTWDNKQEKVVVSISPTLFDSKQVIFLGETFDLIYTALTETDPAVSFDIDGRKIYINPFNKELMQYSVSVLDIFIALEVADAISNDQTELKQNFMSLLGIRTIDVCKYVAPLGDDLRRTMAFRMQGA